MIAMAALSLLVLLQPPQAPARDRVQPAAGAATIEGRVLDATTEAPLRRAVVRLSGAALARRLTLRTDQFGRFAFRDLPPGRYVLSAAKPQYLALEYGQRRPFEQGRRIEVAARETLKNVDVLLPRAGVISGTVIDPSGDPIDRTWVQAFRVGYARGREQWMAVRRTVTNDIGEYRLAGLPPGDYYLVTDEVAIPPTEFTENVPSYARTFYPSTLDRAQAQRVHVGLGQDIVNLDLPVVVARTATLAGIVQREDGSPVAGQRVSLLDGPESGVEGNITGGSSTDAQGRFRISGVHAGTYQLFVRDEDREGVLPVVASGADQLDLVVRPGKGGRISGRVVSSSGEPLPFPTGAVQLAAVTSGDSWQYRRTLTRVAADWTFTAEGLTGPRLIRAPRLPAGWWLKAVMRGNDDVTDTAVEMHHGDALDGFTVVLDDAPVVVTGGVTDAAARPVADYTVIAFAEDASKWGAETRHVCAERPDHAGRFSVAGLPPGNYLIAAVEYVEEGRWLDAQYLESLRPAARKVRLEPGQKTEQDLTVSK